MSTLSKLSRKITVKPIETAGMYGNTYRRGDSRLRAEVFRCYNGQWSVTFALNCGGRFWETLWTGRHVDGKEYHSRSECIAIARAALLTGKAPFTRVVSGECNLSEYLA